MLVPVLLLQGIHGEDRKKSIDFRTDTGNERSTSCGFLVLTKYLVSYSGYRDMELGQTV